MKKQWVIVEHSPKGTYVFRYEGTRASLNKLYPKRSWSHVTGEDLDDECDLMLYGKRVVAMVEIGETGLRNEAI